MNEVFQNLIKNKFKWTYFFNGFYEINRCCDIDYVKLLAIKQLLQKRYENVLSSAAKSVPSPYRYSTAAFKHYLKIHKLITIKMNYPFPSTYIFNCVLWTLLHRRKINVDKKLLLKQCWKLSINVAKEYQRWIPVDISLCAGCKNNYSNWLWNK